MSGTNTPPLSDAKRVLLEERLRGRPHPGQPDGTVPSAGSFPLSAAQEQLWFFSRLAPASPVYNEVVVVRRHGDVDLDALRSAFNAVVRRHDVWHARVEITAGEPRMVVVPATVYELPLVDLSALATGDAEAEAVRMVAAEARRPYDLEHAEMIRPLLVRVTAGEHRLYLALHHLVFDGGSLSQTVLPELVSLYEDSVSGAEPRLSSAPPQYADYAAWEREWVDGEQCARRLEHWRHRLDGAPVLALPLDRPRPARMGFRGATQPVGFDVSLVTGLRALARSHGATLFQAMASSFALLLHRYTGQDDIVFATVADLRQRSTHHGVVGYCVTPLVLRVDAGNDPPFTEMLSRTRAVVLDALDNRVPFERLVRELHPRRDAATTPICQVVLVLEPRAATHDPAWELDLTVPELDNAIGHAKFDMVVELDERPGGEVAGRVVFDTDVLERDTVRRFIEHWSMLLESVVSDPAQALSQVPLLASPERHRQLVEWNDTAAGVGDDACIHELVSTQCALTPHAVAVRDAAGSLTYAELDDHSARLACHLRALGVPPRSLVGVCMERSVDMVVALLAVLRAGAAYVPLEPDHPRARLRLMLDDSRPAAIVTTGHLRDSLPAGESTVVELDTERDTWMTRDPLTGSGARPGDLAYVLYTSGSTGTPKGVMVEHRSIVNQLRWRVGSFGLTSDDRVLQKTPLGFDVSLWELFCPLLCGATMVLLDPGAHTDPRLVTEAIRSERITAVHFVPSMLEQFLSSAGARGCTSLRLVASSGEVLKGSTVERFFTVFGPEVELRNLYGPTEAAIDVTSWPCTPADAMQVPIGRPVANTRVYVLDPRQQLLPVGAFGELCIGGVQVARGYLNQPGITDRCFVDDPFVRGERLYRTGDIARWRPDGVLEFAGRRDDQVKIRGNRVELAEIERAIAAHPSVADAAVVAAAEDVDTALVAYVTAVPGGADPAAGELRAHVAGLLPAAMIPAAFTVLDALPLTPSGKVDRRGLAARAWRRVSPGSAAPRSAMEVTLAALWAALLRVDSVGVDTDFFDLGGHSLLAARLLGEVERETGVVVPLAALIGGDFTVAAMAALIEDSQAREMVADTVDLQPGGDAPPLFFIHSDESTMFTLRHFMGPLGEQQRVVGLLPERVGRRFDRSSSVEQLATPLLDTIREIQPHGPYHLAGFSLGALLAYETAARLEDDGEEVAWLGNLDCETPAVARRLVWLRSPHGFMQRLVERGPRRAALKVARWAWGVLRSVLVRASLLPPRVVDDFDAAGAVAIGTRYQVRANRAPMELFVSADVVDMTGEPALGWDKVHAGSLTIHPIPGTHTSMLTEPHVRMVASIVSTSLRTARAERSQRSA